MNYGKKNASKQQKKVTSKAAMKKKRMGVRLFKAALIICLIIGVLGVISGGILFKKIIDDSPKITPNDVKPSQYITTAYANDGTTALDTFVDAGSNREYKSIQDIPVHLQDAFIAIEDSRFRDHDGIDLKGIARAGIKGVLTLNFSEGASTITQQLIKNSIFPNFIQETKLEKVQRKIQEQYLALQLEKQMDKDEILENYLNTINLGQNTLGVQAASKRYFGKDVSELTLSESAAIAAITQSPTRYNPITNPDENAVRRLKVLEDMLAQELISQEEFDEALADDVYSKIQATNTEYVESLSVSSYFIDEVAKQVSKDLCNELGYTETQAYNAVYSGGLKIITTQDVEMQRICEEEINDNSNYPSTIKWGVSCAITIHHADGTMNNYDHNGLKYYIENKENKKHGLTFDSQDAALAAVDEYIATLTTAEGDTVDKRITLSPQPQASVVVMDQYTGHVKAMVGGRGEKTEERSLNRATQSARQPGSCFKVLSTFVPALDTYGDTLATQIEDSPFKYDSGKQVKNWWGSSYKGNMTIRECITQSANVCTVKKFTEITPALGYKYLTENFALSTLDPKNDIFQPTALGGISRGVYNIEMTAAYAAIANGGVYTEPILYTQIFDHDGNLLYEKTPKTHIALKETTAALITSAMEDVMTKGTGARGRLKNMPAAGKTGTTTDAVDLWLSAYTPYLTASVWTGFDDNDSMNKMNQSFHIVIWKNIMDRIHADYEYKTFEMPTSISKVTLCKKTGLLVSSEACKTYTEYFAPGTAPKDTCPGHGEEPAESTENPEANTSEKPEGGDNSGNGSGNNSGNNSQNNNSEQKPPQAPTIAP